MDDPVLRGIVPTNLLYNEMLANGRIILYIFVKRFESETKRIDVVFCCEKSGRKTDGAAVNGAESAVGERSAVKACPRRNTFG